MATIKYRDLNGYGMVNAPMIHIYVNGPNKLDNEQPINPIALLSQYGTYRFGINKVSFVMED